MGTEVKINGLGVVLSKLKGEEWRIMDAAATGLERGLLYTIGVAQRKYLSGPRPGKLDVRTTRLRNSLAVKLDRTPEQITGQAGTNVAYAAFHEFGFKGTESVRAHTRVLGQTGQDGLPLDNRRLLKTRAGELIGFAESRKRAAGRQKGGLVTIQFVRSHTRKLNYAGRPFMRPALEDSMPVILRQIKAEIRTMEGANG